jgi:hypothetical protein
MWTFDSERAYVRASRDVPAEFLDAEQYRNPPRLLTIATTGDRC